MTRSLRKRLCWWHTALFAAAIAISLLLAWKEVHRHDNPDAPPPYPEISPPSAPDEAPQTSPVPQEEETGRPHD